MTRKGKYLKLVVIPVLVAVAVIAGVAWFRGDDPGALPPLHTVEVDRGAVIEVVRTTGQINPVVNVQVGSQISGIIDEIHVDFNTPVKKGQVLARLDQASYQADVHLAEAELENALAASDLAKVDAERTRELHLRQLASQSDLDQAEAQLRQAKAVVSIRRHTLQRARLELERCTIYSPTDGIVISRDVDVGQTVAASLSAPVLFTIANDLTQMQINADVPESEIGRIEEGQRVTFRVDAYRQEEFSGKVIQIRNHPEMVQNVVTYDTVIAVENPDLKLKPGMTADVSIVVSEAHDVVRIPNTALRARLPESVQIVRADSAGTDGGDRRVYRLTADGVRLETVYVTTGVTDGVRSSITGGGVEPGDVLVTGVALRRQNTGSSANGSSLFRGRQAQY